MIDDPIPFYAEFYTTLQWHGLDLYVDDGDIEF